MIFLRGLLNYLGKNYAFWFFIIGIPLILIFDWMAHLTGHITISELTWAWSATSYGRLIPFGLGFLTAHLFLGKSGNG